MKFGKLILTAMLVAGISMLGAPSDASAQEQQVDQANFGNLISALNNINAQIRALEEADINIEDVQVVNVQDVIRGNNVEAFNNALNRNEVDINILRDALNDNEVIVDALNQNNVQIGQVVAIDVLSGGDVIVFFDPES